MDVINTVKQSEEKIVIANGIEIAYDTFGASSDPALLLVMGLGMQMIAWDENFCKGLAAKGFWVIRFDNRDIGLSAKIAHGGIPDLWSLLQGQAVEVPYTLGDMAQDAFGLLDLLEVDKAHIVGVSMGGMIVQTMALLHPERVLSMVSIMSSTGDPNLPQPSPEAMQLLVTPAPTEREAYLDYQVMVNGLLNGPGFPVDEVKVREFAARVYERGLNPPGFSRQLAAILASGSRKEALKYLDVPTLVIHGEADPLVSIEGGRDTAHTIPGAKLITIGGMGHGLPVEVWPRIIEAISAHAAGG